jgi:GNAT superfamily N-acetyltransferase
LDIKYRPARQEDLATALRVVQEAYNDLRVRHGLLATVPLRPPAFPTFCLAEDPDGLWVAERGEALVGFGFAWMRDRFWYLAQLFVRPGFQGRGIGQALFSKTLQLAKRKGAENRALMTMAYNAASIGLYLRNGLYPRGMLLRLAAPLQSINATAAGPSGYDAVPLGLWPDSREYLGRIDEQVLGFRREEHHAFLLGTAVSALQIQCAGRPAGYAYLAADGHIGPLAVEAGADPRMAIDAATRAAAERTPSQISMIVPGDADRMLDAAFRLGFRIEEPLVLLSARPFGNWRNYLPSNPGFL